jgi:septum formation protein
MRDAADIHPLWLGLSPLVLASGSRTRFELLEAAGLPVEVVRPQDVDERAIAAPLERQGATAEHLAITLAGAKALSVARRMPGRHVLGADQTLTCNGVMLHKPADRSAAADQIAILAGKAHFLHAAVAIARDGQILASFAASARLTMRKLSSGMINRYLDAAGDAVLESVGGYQLERLGVHLFSRIGGDHSTILGLPMLRTLRCLRQLGLVAR